MRIFIKFAQPALCALLLTGAAHSAAANEPPDSQTDPFGYACYVSGDSCSEGGAYGIGTGWSIEIVPPAYEPVSETVMVTGRPPSPAIPATYEWVREDSEILRDKASLTTKAYTIIPAEYETKIVTTVTEYARTEYHLTDATYNPDGSVETPRVVKERRIPAITEEETQQILIIPEQIAERIAPVMRRDGFVRIVKTPASPGRPAFPLTKSIRRTAVKQPGKFLIKSPSGHITKSFRKYDDLTAFVEKRKTNILKWGM